MFKKLKIPKNTKNKIYYLLIGLLIGTLFPVQLLFANNSINPIKLIINGKQVQCDVPPQNINGRVLVPVRFIAEPLGASVEWDGANKAVIITSKQGQAIGDKGVSNTVSDTIKEPISSAINNEINVINKNEIQKTTWNGMNTIIKDGIMYFCVIDYQSLIQDGLVNSPNRISFDKNFKISTITLNGKITQIPHNEENVQIYNGKTYFNVKFYQ